MCLGYIKIFHNFVWDYAICKIKSPWEILESVTREIADGIRKHENYFFFELMLIKLSSLVLHRPGYSFLSMSDLCGFRPGRIL